MAKTEFEIRNNDNSLFCMGRSSGEDILLVTKHCSITLTELVKKATSPQINHEQTRKPKTQK